jgi:hypothetical protein
VEINEHGGTAIHPAKLAALLEYPPLIDMVGDYLLGRATYKLFSLEA